MEPQTNITVRTYIRPNFKPVVSYWKTGDPCYKIDSLKDKLTDITVIRTKRLSDDFINFCIQNKEKIFVHFVISGLNASPLEPKIPTVKSCFFALKKLIDGGFPQKQILVVIDPILPNFNGIEALKLLLRIFTEFKELRLRYVRFNLMKYKFSDDNKYVPDIDALSKRKEIGSYAKFLIRVDDFIKEYYKIIEQYKSIISIDNNEESIIGIRELNAFNYRNEWNDNGTIKKIIEYENGNRYKPNVVVISGKPIRCLNRCILCRNYG